MAHREGENTAAVFPSITSAFATLPSNSRPACKRPSSVKYPGGRLPSDLPLIGSLPLAHSDHETVVAVNDAAVHLAISRHNVGGLPTAASQLIQYYS